MRILKILGLFLLVVPVSPGHGMAGKVVITCDNAASYAGKTLNFLTWNDLITYSEDTLLTVKVKENGTFEGSFTLDEPVKIFVRPGIYEAWFYAEPGKTYKIILPPRCDKTMKDVLNPYFRPVTLQLGIINGGENHLNRLIAKLEEIFSPYFYHHARKVFIDKKDTTLNRFIQSVRDTFVDVDNPFFSDYLNARLAMLTVMNMPERASVLDEYRGFGKKVLFHNPAYMELFNQVFNRYFDYLIHHKYKTRLISAIETTGRDSLIGIIKSDLALDYEDFVDMVALKGIYDAWYNNTFSHDKLIALLERFIVLAENPEIRKVGMDIKKKFTWLQAGTQAPDFVLPALDGQKKHLAGMKGKYVYLNFSSRLSYSSLREYPLLMRLQEKYGNKLQIVTVALEDHPEILKSFVQEKGYNWTFLICGDTCNLPGKYNVRVYPTYYLIDPDGKLILSPAPAPTEDFESRFRGLLKKVRMEGVSIF
ncbi:MAG TPA: TlpA family protein disulfide reductase [Bacteroidetes bacterium]|nr:TlpA family protein disulfide reductase [Bacteroidota bacterium]